jgi:hypothetical protein
MDRGQAPDSRPRLQVDWTGPARQEAQPWHDLESRSVTESRQPVAPFKLSSQGQGCWTSESDCYSHRPGHRRLGDLDSSRAGLAMSLAPRPLSDIDNSSLLNFISQYITNSARCPLFSPSESAQDIKQYSINCTMSRPVAMSRAESRSRASTW